jgi:hypothetical protein
MRSTRVLFIAALAVSHLILTGCGGGSQSPAPAAGLVSRGVVTGSGTLSVNGMFFNLSSASITIDGVPGNRGNLQPGMIVTVRGIFDNHTSHAIRRTATSVEYASDFEGPVDCVNILNNTLTIMGQQVLIGTTSPNQTVFANFSSTRTIFANISTVSKLNPHLSPQFGITPTPLPPLPPPPTLYSIVKVSGFSDDINGFQATRIELIAQGVDLATAVPISITGAVTAADFEGMAFAIGNLSVDYSGMNPVYMPRSLVTGLFVKVKGDSSPANFTPGNAPSLLPASVTLVRGGVPATDGDHVTVAGYVSGLSGTSFMISGTVVNASSISLFGVANAAKVLVEGIFSNGAVQASKITLL